MSINSKIRREAGKQERGQGGRRRSRRAPSSRMRSCATSRADCWPASSAARANGCWAWAGRSRAVRTSAAHVFAMIRRVAMLHEAQGTPVRLTWSDALKDAAYPEAAGQGIDASSKFEAQLERHGGECEDVRRTICPAGHAEKSRRSPAFVRRVTRPDGRVESPTPISKPRAELAAHRYVAGARRVRRFAERGGWIVATRAPGRHAADDRVRKAAIVGHRQADV